MRALTILRLDSHSFGVIDSFAHDRNPVAPRTAAFAANASVFLLTALSNARGAPRPTSVIRENTPPIER
jgi:hypothetical protein